MDEIAQSIKLEHASELLSGVSGLRRDSVIQDFTIKVEGKCIPVHRVVLVATSGYFRAMFSHSVQEVSEGYIDMKNVTYKAVEQSMAFAYTGEANISMDNVEDVADAAELLQLTGLSNLCSNYLKFNLNFENCLLAKRLADMYNWDELKVLSENFAIENLESLITTESFAMLSLAEVGQYLQAAGLEHAVSWAAAIDRIKKGDERNRAHLLQLMEALELEKFPFSFIVSTILKEPLVMSTSQTKNFAARLLLGDKVQLKPNLDTENCFILRELASTSEFPEAKDVIDDFIMENFDLVAQAEEFKSLTFNEVKMILESPHTKCTSETVKFNAAKSWVAKNVSRKRHFPELFKLLKLDQMPLRFIKEKLIVDPLIAEFPECGQCVNLILGLINMEDQMSNAGDEAASNVEAGPIVETDAEGNSTLRKISHGVFANVNVPLREGYKVFSGVKRFGRGIKPTRVAVKMLHIIGHDKTWLSGYLREINNMKSLDDKYVAQFVDCGEVEGAILKTMFIATKLCHSKTLDDIEVKELTNQERLNIILHVCHGLKSIHKLGIAHRDLKPGNILFSQDGKYAVVADFGLSKNVKINHKKSTITRSAGYHGTLAWVATEMTDDNCQVQKQDANQEIQKPQKHDFKADIFALGLFGHFILCDKRHPFCDKKRPDNVTLQHANIVNKKDPDWEALEDMDDGFIFKDLFKKMLSHEPEERPSIKEVLCHCMFWNSIKKVNFFREMHQHFQRRNLAENGTDEQKLSCALVILARESESQSSNATECSNTTSDSDILFEEDASGEGQREAAIFSQIREVATEHWVSKLQKPSETAEGKIVVTSEEVNNETGEDSNNGTQKTISDRGSGGQRQETKRSDEHAYDNTLADLIRYIRNYSVHKTDPNDRNPCGSAWEFFSPLFPKLLPHLFKIMELSFNEEDKQQFKEQTKPCDIDIRRLLHN